MPHLDVSCIMHVLLGPRILRTIFRDPITCSCLLFSATQQGAEPEYCCWFVILVFCFLNGMFHKWGGKLHSFSKKEYRKYFWVKPIFTKKPQNMFWGFCIDV